MSVHLENSLELEKSIDFEDTVVLEKPSEELTLDLSHSKLYENDQVNFDFSMHGFELLEKKTGEYIQSPTFKMENNSEIQWYLKVYPSGDSEENKDYMGVFLHLKSEIPNLKVKADFYLGVQQRFNDYVSNKSSHIFTESKAEFGFAKMIKIEDLNM